MSIVNDWPIKTDYALPERFSSQLIVANERVNIQDLGGGFAQVDVYHQGSATPYMSGQVEYHNQAAKDSIHGRINFVANGKACYIVAYALSVGREWYIFGSAMTHTGAADSGGQWDGNRPK